MFYGQLDKTRHYTSINDFEKMNQQAHKRGFAQDAEDYWSGQDSDRSTKRLSPSPTRNNGRLQFPQAIPEAYPVDVMWPNQPAFQQYSSQQYLSIPTAASYTSSPNSGNISPARGSSSSPLDELFSPEELGLSEAMPTTSSPEDQAIAVKNRPHPDSAAYNAEIVGTIDQHPVSTFGGTAPWDAQRPTNTDTNTAEMSLSLRPLYYGVPPLQVPASDLPYNAQPTDLGWLQSPRRQAPGDDSSMIPGFRPTDGPRAAASESAQILQPQMCFTGINTVRTPAQESCGTEIQQSERAGTNSLFELFGYDYLGQVSHLPAHSTEEASESTSYSQPPVEPHYRPSPLLSPPQTRDPIQTHTPGEALNTQGTYTSSTNCPYVGERGRPENGAKVLSIKCSKRANANGVFGISLHDGNQLSMVYLHPVDTLDEPQDLNLYEAEEESMNDKMNGLGETDLTPCQWVRAARLAVALPPEDQEDYIGFYAGTLSQQFIRCSVEAQATSVVAAVFSTVLNTTCRPIPETTLTGLLTENRTVSGAPAHKFPSGIHNTSGDQLKKLRKLLREKETETLKPWYFGGQEIC